MVMNGIVAIPLLTLRREALPVSIEIDFLIPSTLRAYLAVPLAWKESCAPPDKN